VASAAVGSEGQKTPEGAKVVGMPEVVPQEAEIIKAILPFLKKLGKGLKIENGLVNDAGKIELDKSVFE